MASATSSAFTPALYSSYSSPTTSVATKTYALTTVFTPPSSCAAASRFEAASWANGWIAYGVPFSSDCYPTSYPSTDTNYVIYSPGVCPQSWNYAATTTTWAFQGGYTTTVAVCCPPNFYGLWEAAQKCQEQVTSSWSGLSDFTSGTQIHVAYETAVTIAWQSSDLPLFSPASAPVLAIAAQEGLISATTNTSSSGSASVTTTANGGSTTPDTLQSTQSATSHHSSLSAGAAAGIAVGATVAGIALIALGWVLIQRRYVARRKDSGSAAEGLVSAPNPQTEEMSKGHVLASQAPLAEAPNTSFYGTSYQQVHEADGSRDKVELEAPPFLVEAPGSSPVQR